MRRRIALALLMTLGLWSGCHESQPQVTVEPRLDMSDLAAGLSAAESGFTLLVDQQTEGRFSCALAVAKFVASGDGQHGPLEFVSLPPNEESYWLEQMRGVLAVQELVFLRPRTTRPEGQSVAALCDAARRLKAALLLVYAPNGLGPNSAQVLGVIYDTESRAALATLRSNSRIVDPSGAETSPREVRGDLRDRDARCVAQREFEGYTLACLRELIHRDNPPAATQPHENWDRPFIERWWIQSR